MQKTTPGSDLGLVLLRRSSRIHTNTHTHTHTHTLSLSLLLSLFDGRLNFSRLSPGLDQKLDLVRAAMTCKRNSIAQWEDGVNGAGKRGGRGSFAVASISLMSVRRFEESC